MNIIDTRNVNLIKYNYRSYPHTAPSWTGGGGGRKKMGDISRFEPPEMYITPPESMKTAAGVYKLKVITFFLLGWLFCYSCFSAEDGSQLNTLDRFAVYRLITYISPNLCSYKTTLHRSSIPYCYNDGTYLY